MTTVLEVDQTDLDILRAAAAILGQAMPEAAPNSSSTP